ncbi:MAG: glycosyl hydrolase family 18 protein [Candidatus Zixiibacteriota bacterium]
MKKLFLLSTFVFCIFAQPERGNVVGYFTSWSVYGRDYHIPDIPVDKITHINYAFADIQDGEIALLDPYADIDKYYDGDSWHEDSMRGSFHQLIILKNEYPHVKTLISVGGWTLSTYFSDIAMTEETRSTFARSCIEFIQDYQFDGIDLDWEYPVEGGSPGTHHHPDDKYNYTLLCQEIRRQLDSLAEITDEEYLLTIAAPASHSKLRNYELPELAEILDFINIMAYDYHGPWGGDADVITNFNAAFDISDESPIGEPFYSKFNIRATVDTFLAAGVPPAKINLGLAYYGRGYGNVEDSENGLYQTYSGASPIGTWENGSFDFDDLYHNYIDMAGYSRYWSEQAGVPWLYNPSEQIFISYDDTMSIGIKTRYALENSLGVMMWEFSGDEDNMLTDKIFTIFNSPSRIVENESLPAEIECQIIPNPFNSAATVFSKSGSKIKIYDYKGRLVYQDYIAKNASIPSLKWQPQENIESGLYIIQSEKDGTSTITKAIYIK